MIHMIETPVGIVLKFTEEVEIPFPPLLRGMCRRRRILKCKMQIRPHWPRASPHHFCT